MSGGLERKPGGSSLVQRATADSADLAPGKRTLTGQLGPGVPGAASEHIAAAHQVAERDRLNAVITIVARGPDGAVLARWRARGRWVGPLPTRYHGTRAPLAWTWSNPAARDTRIHTRSDGTGGEPIERWATQHGAATVDVIATALDAAADDEADAAHADPAAAPGPASAVDSPAGADSLAGSVPDQEPLIAEFERQLAIDLDLAVEDNAMGGQGAPGGDPHGRTGPDTAIGGAGPGGPKARAGGDREGSDEGAAWRNRRAEDRDAGERRRGSGRRRGG